MPRSVRSSCGSSDSSSLQQAGRQAVRGPTCQREAAREMAWQAGRRAGRWSPKQGCCSGRQGSRRWLAALAARAPKSAWREVAKRGHGPPYVGQGVDAVVHRPVPLHRSAGEGRHTACQTGGQGVRPPCPAALKPLPCTSCPVPPCSPCPARLACPPAFPPGIFRRWLARNITKLRGSRSSPGVSCRC